MVTIAFRLRSKLHNKSWALLGVVISVTIAFRLRSKLHNWTPWRNPSPTTSHHCLSAAEQAPQIPKDRKFVNCTWSPLPFGCGASSTNDSLGTYCS